MSAASRADDGAAVDAVFAALADPNRRRAVELLQEAPRRAGELAELLSLPGPAMSRHLKFLKQAGLVAETHPDNDARVRIYALQSERLDELKSWLERAEAGWVQQLEALKRAAERST